MISQVKVVLVRRFIKILTKKLRISNLFARSSTKRGKMNFLFCLFVALFLFSLQLLVQQSLPYFTRGGTVFSKRPGLSRHRLPTRLTKTDLDLRGSRLRLHRDPNRRDLQEIAYLLPRGYARAPPNSFPLLNRADFFYFFFPMILYRQSR